MDSMQTGLSGPFFPDIVRERKELYNYEYFQ